MSMMHSKNCNCQICRPQQVSPNLYSETWENTSTAYQARSIELDLDNVWYVNLISSDVVDLTDTDGYRMKLDDWNHKAKLCYANRDYIIEKRKANNYPESTWQLNSVYPLE